MLDVRERRDGLRCREVSWLRARRAELVRVQRAARAEELLIVGILDERGALDACSAATSGVSQRVERETLDTARALEALPAIAAAAAEGHLSDEQLTAVAQLADESTDAEWAERAPNVSPVDLRRMVRTHVKPTVAESWRRREARSLRMWWDESHGLLNIRGELPDLMGAEFEATINHLVDRMLPAKGQAWDTRTHRAADALAQLCSSARHGENATCSNEDARNVDPHAPTAAAKPLLVVHVPIEGPATVAGIPLPDAKLEQLRANATIEPVLVDDDGAPVAVGRRFTALSPKITRSIRLRDGHCRWPGCDHRTGLEIHHLVPRSAGGTDEPANLATVCTVAHHHEQLIPHGPYALLGNPNHPDGLHLVLYAELTPDQANAYGLPPPPPRTHA